MAKECPKCQTNNPETSSYCADCGTPLEVDVVHTKTLETSTKELTTGSIFAGRYKIIEELGKGGMGKVYRVFDQKLNEEVALKLIKPDIAADKKTIERFKNELRLARKISHKNVGRMYEFLEDKDTHFITMEYISGQDLKSAIHQMGQFTVGKAISIAKQICEGLTEAHSLGVVHRDLKPNNIMIDRGGNAKIMDFGIARAVKEKSITGAGVVIGTPQYMSPEQVEGKDVDQRSDIYSLGIILYEILTDRVPFEGDTPLTVGVKQKTEIPKDPKEFNERISDDLNQIILKCLEKKPENRFQTTGEICSELTRIEQGLPTTERIDLKPGPTTSKQITVSFTPKKFLIPAVVLAAILIVIMLIWKPWGGTSLFQPSDSGLPSIGFLKLRNGMEDPNLDHLCRLIPDLMNSDIDQSPYFRVQSAEVINQVLRQMNLSEETSFAADELREIARRSGVKILITGYFSKLGENFRINISLNNAEKGDVIATERADGESEKSIYVLVDELTRKIKSNFNLTEAQLSNDQDKEIGIITTPYPEAYRLYSQGRELFLRQQFQESIPLMKSAIQIDPDFAMAYRSIATAYRNMGILFYPDEVKKYYNLALEKSDRLSYKEKKLIEAQHSQWVENDWRKALSIYKEVLEEYPEDNVFNWAIAVLYGRRLDFDNAIHHYEICRKNRVESVIPYNNLAWANMAIGEYEKAREVYRDCIEIFGDTADLRSSIAMTYICERKIDEAVPEAQKAIEMNPRAFWMGSIDQLKGDFEAAESDYKKWLNDDDVRIRVNSHYLLTILNMTQGKYERAASFAEEGLAIAKNADLSDLVSQFLVMKLWCYIAVGRFVEALSEAKESPDPMSSLIISTFAYYQTHQVERIQETAEMVLDALETNDVPDISIGLFIRGLADVTAEKYENATEILNRAWTMQIYERSFNDLHILFLYYLGEAQLLGRNLEVALQTFEQAIKLTTGKLTFGDLWAKSHLRLGEVYEKLGNINKAIEHTEKFLEMWKDADPGLPEVDDAKKRLAGLRE